MKGISLGFFVNFALDFSINSLQRIVAKNSERDTKHIWVFSYRPGIC